MEIRFDGEISLLNSEKWVINLLIVDTFHYLEATFHSQSNFYLYFFLAGNKERNSQIQTMFLKTWDFEHNK